MDQIIRDLHRGNIAESNRKPAPEYKRALGVVTRLEEELAKELPSELLPKFRKYSAACSELACVGYEEEFLFGYRIGTRFILAGLSGWPPLDGESIPE